MYELSREIDKAHYMLMSAAETFAICVVIYLVIKLYVWREETRKKNLK